MQSAEIKELYEQKTGAPPTPGVAKFIDQLKVREVAKIWSAMGDGEDFIGAIKRIISDMVVKAGGSLDENIDLETQLAKLEELKKNADVEAQKAKEEKAKEKERLLEVRKNRELEEKERAAREAKEKEERDAERKRQDAIAKKEAAEVAEKQAAAEKAEAEAKAAEAARVKAMEEAKEAEGMRASAQQQEEAAKRIAKATAAKELAEKAGAEARARAEAEKAAAKAAQDRAKAITEAQEMAKAAEAEEEKNREAEGKVRAQQKEEEEAKLREAEEEEKREAEEEEKERAEEEEGNADEPEEEEAMGVPLTITLNDAEEQLGIHGLIAVGKKVRAIELVPEGACDRAGMKSASVIRMVHGQRITDKEALMEAVKAVRAEGLLSFEVMVEPPLTKDELEKDLEKVKEERREVTKKRVMDAMDTAHQLIIDMCVVSARELVAGSSDKCYCEIKLRTCVGGKVGSDHPNPQKQLTKVVKSLNPQFDHKLRLIVPPSDAIRISIFASKTIGKEYKGKVDLILKDVIPQLNCGGKAIVTSYPITGDEQKAGGHPVSGWLDVAMRVKGYVQE
ncbi:hypothetical protein DIPPA_30675 [Diplonema papillatum]|nr:hypothetical protein DIPPA_30675 [Diplonema papillatum]KAJ9450059.1 hypothetical protein DIPPA_30675 [Diplonema papillatum]